MARTFLVEIGCLISGVQSTLRYSWSAALGWQTRPSDTPASEPYHPRLVSCSFGYPVIGDALHLGNGQIVLDNTDATLDVLLGYVYDNQTARLLTGDDSTDAYAAFVELGKWTLEQPDDGDQRIVLITHTPIYALDQAMQSKRFLGTGGVDGGAELAEKPLPFAYGPIVRQKAILVDPTQNIYLLSARPDPIGVPPDDVITGVYDQAVALTPGADYASVAAMQATAPAAGAYRICPASASGGTYQYATFVRLGSTAIGDITFSGECHQWSVLLTPSRVDDFLYSMILSATNGGGVLYASDITRVVARFPLKVEFAFGSDGTPATYLDALGQVLTGGRAWIVPYQAHGSTTTRFAARWLDDPATVAIFPPNPFLSGVLTVNGARVLSMKRTSKYEFGWPEFRTTVLYDRLQYVQKQGFAGAVTAEDRQRLGLEYLSASDLDATIKTSYPTAVDRTVPSAFSSDGVGAAGIEAEAAYQRNVFSVHRAPYQLSARADLLDAARTVPGDPITIVEYERFGCDVSRTFLILGIEIDYLAYDAGAGTVGFTATIWA